MRKFFVLLSCLIAVCTFSLKAQNDEKYLVGAVPEVGGKVVFTKTIRSNITTDNSLFQLADKWMKDNYPEKNAEGKDTGNKILLSNPDGLSLACIGQEKIDVGQGLFSRRYSMMSYTLTLKIKGDKCELSIRKITYQTIGDEKILDAEGMITDKVALNKSNGLKNYYDNFRRGTIDLVDKIEQSLHAYINNSGQEVAPKVKLTPASPVSEKTNTPQIQAQETVVTQPVIAKSKGFLYSQANAKEYSDYWKTLNEQSSVILSSGQLVELAKWGGIGELLGKSVVTAFIPSGDVLDTYTIAIYKNEYHEALKDGALSLVESPSGDTIYSGAWLIVKCHKMVVQPQDAGGYMCVGEIVNVWKMK